MRVARKFEIYAYNFLTSRDKTFYFLPDNVILLVGTMNLWTRELRGD